MQCRKAATLRSAGSSARVDRPHEEKRWLLKSSHWRRIFIVRRSVNRPFESLDYALRPGPTPKIADWSRDNRQRKQNASALTSPRRLVVTAFQLEVAALPISVAAAPRVQDSTRGRSMTTYIGRRVPRREGLHRLPFVVVILLCYVSALNENAFNL